MNPTPTDGAYEVTRATLEATARIIGPQSAAAHALAAASDYADPVFFLMGDMVVVSERDAAGGQQ